jgi:hypothetical protein
MIVNDMVVAENFQLIICLLPDVWFGVMERPGATIALRLLDLNEQTSSRCRWQVPSVPIRSHHASVATARLGHRFLRDHNGNLSDCSACLACTMGVCKLVK